MFDKIEQAIEKILNIPHDFHLMQTKSWNTLLEDSGYFELNKNITEIEIVGILKKHPHFIAQWLQWSDDQRCSPAWYFTKDNNGNCFVGHYPEGIEYTEMNTKNEFEACAYFIKCNIERSKQYLKNKP